MPSMVFAMALLTAATLALETNSATAEDNPGAVCVRVNDTTPLFHYGLNDYNLPGHREDKFLRAMLTAAADQTPKNGSSALALFKDIKENKRDSGQYTALAWFADILRQPPAYRDILFRDDYTRSYYTYFMGDKGSVLIDYLNRMYQFEPAGEISPRDVQQRIIMRSEMLMTLHPVRLTTPVRRRILELLAVTPGMRILDINASAGHLAFALAQRAGPEGHVYAMVNNAAARPYHVEYLRTAIDTLKTHNITMIPGGRDDIGMTNVVDVAILNFMYPDMYIGLGESERNHLFAGIGAVINPGGRLVVIEMDRPETRTAGYQISYVDSALVQAQIVPYGYRLQYREQLPGGMYVLVFERVGSGAAKAADVPDIRVSALDELIINTRHSLMYFTLSEADSRSATHTNAARLLKQALDIGDRSMARRAYDKFKAISDVEPVGGDYTALQWFSDYFASDDTRRAAMLQDRFVRSYFRHFTANDNRLLHMIIKYLYLESLPGPEVEAAEGVTSTLDALLFNNPLREEWEHTSQIVECLHLRPGETVADIGSGPGFYSFKFADRVGSNGVVYAMELGDEHLNYIRNVCREYGINNIRTVQSRPTDICVSNALDVAFLCSLYHAIYLCSPSQDIKAFIDSISRVLKPEGRLVIADNTIVGDAIRPYHGPRIAKEILILHLRQFGYVLESTHQFTPQRYVLIFRKK